MIPAYNPQLGLRGSRIHLTEVFFVIYPQESAMYIKISLLSQHKVTAPKPCIRRRVGHNMLPSETSSSVLPPRKDTNPIPSGYHQQS